MNRRHMTDDHHGRTAGRAALPVRAVDEILGTHKVQGSNGPIFCQATLDSGSGANNVEGVSVAMRKSPHVAPMLSVDARPLPSRDVSQILGPARWRPSSRDRGRHSR